MTSLVVSTPMLIVCPSTSRRRAKAPGTVAGVDSEPLMRYMPSCIRTTVAVVGIASSVLIGCSEPSAPIGASTAPSTESISSSTPTVPTREILVATTMTTADLVRERVCLDQRGSYILEAEAESENAATGFLTLDDSSVEGEYITSAMRFAGQPRRLRSEEVELNAGEPCYLISVQTGIVGDRATARLIRLAADD